jgi:hypothetical protein
LNEPESKEPDDKAKKAMKAKLEELKKKKLPAPAPSFSRRAALVDVALEAENQIFLARSLVNQLWKQHFGMGLIDPVDQMHPENQGSHPELLEWLSQDLISNQFNVRRLTEAIVMSEAYGRSSQWLHGDPPPDYWFAVAQVRPLTPRQYAMTLRMGATSPSYFDVDAGEHSNRVQRLRSAANGMTRYFDPVSGDFQVSVTEALLMSNSKEMEQQLLRVDNDSLIKYLLDKPSAGEQASAAWQQILGQAPDDESLAAMTQFLQDNDQPEQAVKQVVWGLLCSSACRFNY